MSFGCAFVYREKNPPHPLGNATMKLRRCTWPSRTPRSLLPMTRNKAHILSIKKDVESPAVEANLANVQNGNYPLSRPLFFYLRNKAAGDIKAFIDWVLSAEGQEIVTKVGYFPVK
jgi:hypothetical protein